MKKTALVPVADHLESRTVMSGIHFLNGLPVLTTAAVNKTYSEIRSAYTTFATKGENYNLLSHNLANAVGRIPFNVRDGLSAQVKNTSGLKANLKNQVDHPVIKAFDATIAEMSSFIRSEVKAGIFVYV
jgi:hypothetical protein